MTPAWAQRREELLSDCMVAPDVFQQMVDRLGEFVVPYQHALETEAGQRNVHLSLQGLLSHLPGKNAEDIATFVDVQRQVLQAFIGTTPWDHQPLIEVLVGQVADRLGRLMASSRSIPAVSPNAVRTRWGSNGNGAATGGRSTTARSVSSWGMSLVKSMLCSTSVCPCLRSGHGTSHDVKHATCHQRCAITRATRSAWRCSTRGVSRCHTAG